MTKRIIISGAPGTGKTSIINTLSNQGYFCHPEISREIISGGTITPWQELDKFSELVIRERVNQYNSATNKIEFYDRSIIDSFAYLLKDKIPIKKSWHDLAINHKYYNTVFISPPWEEIYTQDNERKENYKQAEEIHKYMIKAYKKYAYNICIIPKMSIKERVNFIIKQIEQ